jgi:cytosine/adenosine deaminase-related metal-dependent hydrolase
MIIRARTVLTMDGPVIPNGAIAISGNTIADVGTYDDVRGRNTGAVRDLGDRTLLPGLINAHCHLDYTGLRGRIAPQASFADWIRAINERKASLTPDDYLQAIDAGFTEALNFGTTAVANLEAFPGLLPRIPASAVRTWWFAELIDVRQPVSAGAVCQELRDAVAERGARLNHGGLAPHAPFTASPNLYRDCADVARQRNLPLTTHLSESRDEMQMFHDGGGPLFDFMQAIGRPINDCGESTPLAMMLSRGLLDERWLVAHLNELAARDLELLASAPRFHIVHCPRSHAYFGHTPFAFQGLRALGFNISVGTDSLASNEDLSLLRELRQFAHVEPSVTPNELLEMVTTRAAAALRQSGTLGRIRAGFLADLIAVPTAGDARRAAEKVLAFDAEVPWVMIDGEEQTRR